MIGVPLRFWLVEELPDHTEIVAEGTEFSDGSVALCIPGCQPACWDSTEAMLAVHGHDGEAVLHWLDKDPLLRHAIA